MDEPSPHEQVIRELIEVHGYRPVPRPERWYATPRGRVRAAAWTGLAALVVLVGVVTPVLTVSETAGIALALLALGVGFLCSVAIYVDVIAAARPGAEEDENERAVARMVSGRGVRRRD